MISVAFAADQLDRLMGMVGFPIGREKARYVLEMRKAIQSARSEAVAEQAVSDMLRAHTRCPAVADIYTAMSEENARGEDTPVFVVPHYRCSLCGDSGIVGGIFNGKGRDAGPARW